MEEYQPRIPSSQNYQTLRKLVRQPHQPYEEDDLDDTPLEEEAKVLPLQSKLRSPESLADDVVLRSGKRKSSNSSQRKTKSTAGKQKTSKSSRSTASPNSHLFIDELQKLEAQADRINQILAERAKKKDQEQTQRMPGVSASSGQPMFSQQPTLPQQPYQGAMPSSDEWFSPPFPGQEEAEKPVSHPWNPQFQERMHPRQQQQAEDAWQTAADLRSLNHSGHGAYRSESLPGLEGQNYPAFRQKPMATGSSSQLPSFPWRYLGLGRFLEIPRKPMERISDGALWVLAGAIARVLSRSILMLVPGLSPVLTLLMLAPAMLAVLLVLFVPRLGWVPFYRLFLITLGLLIGGKF